MVRSMRLVHIPLIPCVFLRSPMHRSPSVFCFLRPASPPAPRAAKPKASNLSPRTPVTGLTVQRLFEHLLSDLGEINCKRSESGNLAFRLQTTDRRLLQAASVRAVFLAPYVSIIPWSMFLYTQRENPQSDRSSHLMA